MSEPATAAISPPPVTTMIGSNRVIALGLAALIFIVDQATKWVVIELLELPRRRVIELLSFFDLRWVENPGVSMGLLVASSDTQRWLLVALTATIAVVVLVWLWRETSRGDSIALALVLGGASGNIVDRIRFGYVADFADLHFGAWQPFLVFNVGDAAITIGVLLLLFRALLTRNGKTSRKEA